MIFKGRVCVVVFNAFFLFMFVPVCVTCSIQVFSSVSSSVFIFSISVCVPSSCNSHFKHNDGLLVVFSVLLSNQMDFFFQYRDASFAFFLLFSTLLRPSYQFSAWVVSVCVCVCVRVCVCVCFPLWLIVCFSTDQC